MSNQFNATNLLIGAGVSLFEVTTLGQPLEVLKTHMASHREDNLRTAIKKTYGRGRLSGFYQGLIPWAWIESSTAGGILLLTSSTLESLTQQRGYSSGTGGMIGGIGGGVAQGYGMAITTFMKTQEVTRARQTQVMKKVVVGHPTFSPPPLSSLEHFMIIFKKEGIKGVTKGSNAVALRQASNWGSRMGGQRFAEEGIKNWKGMGKGEKLSTTDKIGASAIGGVFACWNHPIEVIRVEMQSLANTTSLARPAKLTIVNTFMYIYKESGIRGLFRGVTPRIGLSVYRTICLVTLADYVKAIVAAK